MGKIGDNPYPGARAFRPSDQAHFFGRDSDTAAIVDHWMTNRLTVVTGPVASGKTSLLIAGVYPRMPVKRSLLLPPGTVRHGLAFPFAALPEHNPYTLGLLRSWSPGDLATGLVGLTVSDFVRRFRQGTSEVTYAAVDHLDDLLLDSGPGADPVWRQQFLAELKQAVADHPRLHLLLVARSETLDLLTAAVGGGARHALAGLTVGAAIEAVTKPALRAGRSFTPEAVTGLIDDLRVSRSGNGSRDESRIDDQPVEPSLLQIACHQLWDDLPASVHEVDERVVQEFADTDAALTAYCGQVIGEVAAEYDVPVKQLRSCLLGVLLSQQGIRADDRKAGVLTTAVIRRLTDQHLLTCYVEGSVRYYRLLSSRLAEPLQAAVAHRRNSPTTAQYLAAAEWDLAHGELGFAQRHAERARDGAASLRERAQAESLLGNVAFRRGRSRGAIADHQAQAREHHRAAVSLFQAAGDTGAAAYQLAAVGRLHLAQSQASVALGQFEAAESHAVAALDDLRAAVQRAPSDLVLQTQLALAFWQRGDGQAAVATLNRVLTSDGGYTDALRARGEILADLGYSHADKKYSNLALNDLKRVLPDHPSTQAARGLAYAVSEDYATAAKEVKNAVNGSQQNGLVLLYAARVLDLAGDEAAARERAKEATDATDPPLSPVHRRQAMKLAAASSGKAVPGP